MLRIITSLFLSGLFFGAGPCMLTCGPILVSYIGGTKKNIFQGLKVYILFSLGRIIVYIILGLALFFLGRFALERLLGDYSKYIMVTGGSFIILVGLFVCFGKQLELSCKCLMPQFAEKLSFFLQSDILEKDVKSAIVLGLIIGLLPCAPLLAVLSYIGLISKSWVSSFWFSFSFGAGTFMSPLILLSIFAGWVPEFLKEKRANYLRIFSFFCGLIIIFLGIQLIGRAY